ncbi:hypothetical protein AX16_000518 [Volvariella volvacea WC 439]|nr:hypothetical protein AX16_000518 [Volvariella volvacea WC 439]
MRRSAVTTIRRTLRPTTNAKTSPFVTQYESISAAGRRHHSALAQHQPSPRTRPRPDVISIHDDILVQHPHLRPQLQPQLQPLQQPIQPAPSYQQLKKTHVDPYTLLAPELEQLRKSLLNLLGNTHPGLNEIAQCYFLRPTKQLRPLLVLLFSRATNGLGMDWEHKRLSANKEIETGRVEELDRPLTHPDVLYDWHPNMPDHTASFQSVFELQTPSSVPRTYEEWEHATLTSSSTSSSAVLNQLVDPPQLLPSQMRLAHIVEMIHVATLLHETISDVEPDVDASPSSFGFGNKLSILGGDFLLGRASAALSRLGESRVVELIASVISNHVEGEFLAMGEVKTPGLGVQRGPETLGDAWNMYLKKTYFKTASLMAKGARSAAVLGGCKESEAWGDVAYAYSRDLGTAYQLMNDATDYEVDSASLLPGLAAGPALYAWEEYPDLGPLIQRNFTQKGDIEQIIQYVNKSSGIERTRLLAGSYAERARRSLEALPDSDTKFALEALTELVVKPSRW